MKKVVGVRYPRLSTTVRHWYETIFFFKITILYFIVKQNWKECGIISIGGKLFESLTWLLSFHVLWWSLIKKFGLKIHGSWLVLKYYLFYKSIRNVFDTITFKAAWWRLYLYICGRIWKVLYLRKSCFSIENM